MPGNDSHSRVIQWEEFLSNSINAALGSNVLLNSIWPNPNVGVGKVKCCGLGLDLHLRVVNRTIGQQDNRTITMDSAEVATYGIEFYCAGTRGLL